MLKLKEAQPSKARAVADDSVRETVQRVIAEVESEGDVALRRYSEQFDKWSPESFRLAPE